MGERRSRLVICLRLSPHRQVRQEQGDLGKGDENHRRQNQDQQKKEEEQQQQQQQQEQQQQSEEQKKEEQEELLKEIYEKSETSNRLNLLKKIKES